MNEIMDSQSVLRTKIFNQSDSRKSAMKTIMFLDKKNRDIFTIALQLQDLKGIVALIKKR